MKRSNWMKYSVAATAFAVAGVLPASPPSAAVEAAAPDGLHSVIVLLKDQLDATPASSGFESRQRAAAAAQAPIVASLQHTRQRAVKSFSVINGFATTVTAAEQASLAADPSVRAVVPDLMLHLPQHTRDLAHAAASSAPPSSTTPDGQLLCNRLEPEALQLTNAAFPDSAAPQAQQLVDGNGAFIRGKGVKVAFIADGIDINLPGFVHTDGSKVFVDYKDFSGDPSTAATAGGEAFGDASSIAAQDTPNGKPLKYDISKFVNESHPLPSPCNIRIRGMAPQASLVGLKVFALAGASTSNFVQAIDYAVSTKVDVLNESFGGNPYPDDSNDPITLADVAAVNAGVTVVVSTGDAGIGTLGSPATNPSVIAAGASTQYRFNAQTVDGVAAFSKGWVSNNVSPFSSSGFAQLTPRTVDVLAPGDGSWALCSTNPSLYEDCSNFKNTPGATPIESFGGTSEAAPLTAGAAALVIQAYRSTHGGVSPTPDKVKRVLMSSASDLQAPTFEQGAGLIDALAAVKMAMALPDSHSTGRQAGQGLLLSQTSAVYTGLPGTAETLSFNVANTGNTNRRVSPSLETLTERVAGTTSAVTLDPAKDPTFLNVVGAPRSYVKRTFVVPANAQHLDASIAWSTASGQSPIAYIGLLDPKGRQVNYSVPQGLGSGYGHVDAVSPMPGTWTAVIWTRPAGMSGSYAGPVEFTWTAERRVAFGTVTPATLDLAPGQSKVVTVSFKMPSQAGDSSASVRFLHLTGDTTNEQAALPVTFRTLVPLTANGGTFSGILTGGNARPDVGPYQTFAFDVPSGMSNIALTLQAPDNGGPLEGLLVDPNGMELSVQPNVDALDDLQYGLTVSHFNPQAGRWKFVLLQNFTASGNETELPFTARVGFNTALYAASGLPASAKTTVSASAGATVPVELENTGATTNAFFIDARRTGMVSQSLPIDPACTVTVLPFGDGCAVVPTETSTLVMAAQSSVPLTMDMANEVGFNYGGTGTPDVWGKTTGTNKVAATLSEPEIPYGLWAAFPSQIGPYGAAGAPTKSVTYTGDGDDPTVRHRRHVISGRFLGG